MVTRLVHCVIESLESRQLLTAANAFDVTKLVADQASVGVKVDPDLVNGWGIAIGSTGAPWVAANGTGKSTVYDGAGNTLLAPVTIPTPSGTGDSAPTGVVFNPTADFVVSKGGIHGAASFIFATEDGTIAGWSGGVDGANAIIAVNQSAQHAKFKGLALLRTGGKTYLYAADFHNNRIAVFGPNFKPVALPGKFADPRRPAGYAPFNITNIGGLLYVAYARQDAQKNDELAGPGAGFVDVFKPNGTFRERLASRGPLNAPWAITRAPAGFGPFAGDILIGNFGDGKINVYNPTTKKFVATLEKPDSTPVIVNGLWGLAFGKAGTADAGSLFFAAGPNDESQGLFGKITIH